LIFHLFLLSDHFISGKTGAVQTVSFGYEYIMAISDPFAPPPIPEPSSYAMLLAGLGLLGFAVHRRKQNA